MRRASLGQRVGWAAEMAAVRALRLALSPLSDDRTVRVMGWLGRRAAAVPALRRRIEANLDLVRPGMAPADRRALARAVFDNFARLCGEYARLGRLAGDPGLIGVTGAEHLAAAGDRPLILATAHYGNWEMVRLAARRLGRPCAIMRRPFDNPAFDAFCLTLIAEAGEPVLHKGREGGMKLYRHLRSGGAALLLADQRETGSPLIPFLGREAETATAVADFALRTGAVVVPACARRLPDGRRFEVAFEPPIRDGAPEDMMRELNRRMSAWIEADPGQWLWSHRRWGKDAS